MKIPINRNSLWAEFFADQLSGEGIKYACISPGSRSTPLTLAFASNKKIKTFVNIDERSTAFFALGLAEKSNTPVVLVTTSGTAVAELYPAITESYQRRIPLIICTADRPPELLNCGANQTINQKNIYKNHIRKFYNAGLPTITEAGLNKIKLIAAEAVALSKGISRGPVHINFPFRKPLEPQSHTDLIEEHLLKKLKNKNIKPINFSKEKKDIVDNSFIVSSVKKNTKGLIFCGWDNFDSGFPRLLNKFSELSGYPVIADGISGLRFGNLSGKNIISNASAFLRSDAFNFLLQTDIIFMFGSAPTSNIVLEFLKKTKARKFQINAYGDYKDPSRTTERIIKINPSDLLKNINSSLRQSNYKPSSSWKNKIKQFDGLTEKIKEQKIFKAGFPFEGRIIPEIIRIIPAKSNLVISNSMPVRDLDFFSSHVNKKINVYTNRGASGIDGIISTAAGIAVNSKFPTYLIIGDLAFLHDANGMNILRNYNIPLKIVLIDNEGGGIFRILPVAANKKYFTEYFQTPQSVDFKALVKAYGGHFLNIKNWKDLNKLNSDSSSGKFSVFRIKTDAQKSIDIRKKYWETVNQQINSLL